MSKWVFMSNVYAHFLQTTQGYSHTCKGTDTYKKYGTHIPSLLKVLEEISILKHKSTLRTLEEGLPWWRSG